MITYNTVRGAVKALVGVICMKAGKIILALVLGVVAIGFALKALGLLLHLIWPLAVVGGLAYVIFRLVGKKSIGSNKHEYLP